MEVIVFLGSLLLENKVEEVKCLQATTCMCNTCKASKRTCRQQLKNTKSGYFTAESIKQGLLVSSGWIKKNIKNKKHPASLDNHQKVGVPRLWQKLCLCHLSRLFFLIQNLLRHFHYIMPLSQQNSWQLNADYARIQSLCISPCSITEPSNIPLMHSDSNIFL